MDPNSFKLVRRAHGASALSVFLSLRRISRASLPTYYVKLVVFLSFCDSMANLRLKVQASQEFSSVREVDVGIGFSKLAN